MFDPLFLKKFNIETTIKYLHDVVIFKKIEPIFLKNYIKIIKKAEINLSKTRLEKFECFFRQLNKDGCDDRYSDRISIRFINSTVGYGVYAEEDIPPYSILNHYTGELKTYKFVNSTNDYLFSFSHLENYVIDAKDSGNWTRFMNHNSSKDSLNVVPWEYYSDLGPKIVFTSGSKGIKKGKQLLFSYGDDYWEERNIACLKF